MIADTTTAIQGFVSHLDNEGRISLVTALRNAASEEFDWIYNASTTSKREADYHRKRWQDFTDAAQYLDALVNWESLH